MITQKDLATIAIALRELTQQLQAVSGTPRLDAELIIAHALDRPRSFLYAYPEQKLQAELVQTILEYIDRRRQGEPLAYIIGQKEFWSLEFKVTADTLIPRPETEHIIEWALENLPTNNARIADLGTGSGAIAITLAYERPAWQIHATDMSAAALHVAINNAQHLKVNNIQFYLGSWFTALPNERYSAIISNPPYIAPNDPHLNNLCFEPLHALQADNEGLAAFYSIINEAKNHLLPGGKLILEHGYNQASILSRLLAESGFMYIESHCDLAAKTRFIVATV